MSKYPVKIKRSGTALAHRGESEVVPARATPNSRATFRYVYASISLEGGKARVKARRAKLTDGAFESESFEGDVGPEVFDRAIAEAQRQFMAHTALFWQSFASLLPFHGRRSGDPE